MYKQFAIFVFTCETVHLQPAQQVTMTAVNTSCRFNHVMCYSAKHLPGHPTCAAYHYDKTRQSFQSYRYMQDCFIQSCSNCNILTVDISGKASESSHIILILTCHIDKPQCTRFINSKKYNNICSYVVCIQLSGLIKAQFPGRPVKFAQHVWEVFSYANFAKRINSIDVMDCIKILEIDLFSNHQQQDYIKLILI